MSWYLARLLMKSSINYDSGSLFMEEFVLTRADSYDEAYAKASNKGVTMEHSYLNERGETIYWSFQCVLEIKEVIDDEILDGTEIYARTLLEAPDIVPRTSLDD